MKETPGDILHMCTKNYDPMMYVSWDMVRDERTDGPTDRRKTAGWKDRGKKGYIEIGAPPKNQNWAYL